MSNSRIIRPVAGRVASPEALELNLQDVEALGRQIIREAMQSLHEANTRKSEVEAEIRQRKESMEAEIQAHREELEAELADLRSRVDSLREEARREGLEIGRKEAHEEGFECGRKDGFEKGYEDGRQAGYSEGREAEIGRLREETAHLVDTVRHVTSALGASRGELTRQAREELVRLAVRVAEKIVRRQVAIDETVIVDTVREAIDRVSRASRIVVAVHPDDLATIEKYTGELLRAIGASEPFTVEEDASVERGGCRVTAGTGSIDLTVATQLEKIETALVDAVPAEEIPLDPVSRRHGEAAPPEEEKSEEQRVEEEVS